MSDHINFQLAVYPSLVSMESYEVFYVSTQYDKLYLLRICSLSLLTSSILLRETIYHPSMVSLKHVEKLCSSIHSPTKTARNYLQYRRHSLNREILLIGRQFCLWFRRLSLHREDRFPSKKTKQWCALQFVFARLTTVVFRWRLKKDGDNPAFFDRCTAYLQS